MQKKPLAALAALSLLSASPVLAHADPVSGTIARAETGAFLEAGVLHQHYTEYNPDGTVPDQETGDLAAVTLGAAALHPGSGLYWRAALTYAGGSTQYSGATFAGTPVQASTDNTLTDLNGRIGYAFGVGQAAIVPYVAVGERTWRRNVGYVEHYANGYYGVGLLADYVPARRWVIGLDGLAGYTRGAQLSTTLGEAAPNIVAPGTETLGDRPYAEGGAKLVYLLNPTWRLRLGVRYVHFSYAASAPVTIVQGGSVIYLQEPDSTTNQVQYSLGMGARF